MCHVGFHVELGCCCCGYLFPLLSFSTSEATATRTQRARNAPNGTWWSSTARLAASARRSLYSASISAAMASACATASFDEMRPESTSHWASPCSRVERIRAHGLACARPRFAAPLRTRVTKVRYRRRRAHCSSGGSVTDAARAAVAWTAADAARTTVRSHRRLPLLAPPPPPLAPPPFAPCAAAAEERLDSWSTAFELHHPEPTARRSTQHAVRGITARTFGIGVGQWGWQRGDDRDADATGHGTRHDATAALARAPAHLRYVQYRAHASKVLVFPLLLRVLVICPNT